MKCVCIIKSFIIFAPEKIFMNKILQFIIIFNLIMFAACSEDDADHCTDGVQNSGEAGIDCGADCPACADPSCTDGIQNQNEAAVDCGGPCAACVSKFSGTVDNQSVSIKEGEANYFLNTSVYTNSVSSNCAKDFSAFLYGPGQKNSISVRLNDYYLGNCTGPDSLQFHTLFSTGSQGLATSATDDGVLITWYDSNGKGWNSALGTQPAVTMNITATSVMSPSDNYQRHKIKLNINCRVYDSLGNYLPLSGVFDFYVRSK